MKIKELLSRLEKNDAKAYPFPQDLDAYLNDFIPHVLLKSETLQIAFGVTDHEMESLYAEAFEHYEKNEIAQAKLVFRFLVVLNHFLTKFWKGLAACQQLLESYDEALHSYAVAALLNKDDPYPHFYAFECYSAQKNKNEAKKALHLAHVRALAREEYKTLCHQIENQYCEKLS